MKHLASTVLLLLATGVAAPLGCSTGSDSAFVHASGAGPDTSTTTGGASSSSSTSGAGGASTSSTSSSSTSSTSSSGSTSSSSSSTSSTSSGSSTSSSSSSSSSSGGDPCAGVQCDNPPSACYAQNGTCQNGACSYAFANGVSCSDGNACTAADTCSSGVCSGQPIVCNSPPPPFCTNSTTLRTYSNGACSAGSCNYPFSDASCPSCMNGLCGVQGCGNVSFPFFLAGDDPSLGHACGSACLSDWCWCMPCMSQSGPGAKLPAGNYNVDFYIGPSGTVSYAFEVFDATAQVSLAADTATYSTFAHHDLPFTAPAGCHALEFRVTSKQNLCSRNYGTTITTL